MPQSTYLDWWRKIIRPSEESREISASPLHVTTSCSARLTQPKGPQPVMQVPCNVDGVSDILKRACRWSESCRLHHIATITRPYLNSLCPILFPFNRRSHFALQAGSFPSSGTSTSPRLAMRDWLSTAQLVRPSHSTHLGHGADDISIR